MTLKQAWMIILFVLGFFQPIYGDEQEKCNVEYALMRAYGTSNGKNPPDIKTGSNVCKQGAKAIAGEVTKQAIKKGSGIINLGEKLNSGSMLFHVHIIYVYRFVHKGKPTTEWEIKQKKKILTRHGDDVFKNMSDAESRIKEEVQKIRKNLTEELKKQCEEHQD